MKQTIKKTFATSIVVMSLSVSFNAFTQVPAQLSEQELRIQQAQNQYTAADHRAKEWGLTKEEWARYETLMNGKRGVWSPKLDPLTTLGIEAKTYEERQRYAELLVKKSFERAEKELAFQREYDAAWQRIYPGILPVNTSDDPYSRVPYSPVFGRLALFVEDNCNACDSILDDVISGGYPVDIYLSGTKNEDEIVRNWALKRKINPALVKSGSVTLNHDSGQWEALANQKMPALLQEQRGLWRQVVLPAKTEGKQ